MRVLFALLLCILLSGCPKSPIPTNAEIEAEIETETNAIVDSNENLIPFLPAPAPTTNKIIPSNAVLLHSDMTKSAWRVFGPSAPLPFLAAQIHQESSWRTDAISRANAKGLAQFTPGTAEDMARLHPEECAPANPFSPKWAFTCRDRYMYKLKGLVSNEHTNNCTDWALAARSYNGGYGWIKKDRAMAKANSQDPDNWQVLEFYNAGRSTANFHENIEYPVRIYKLQDRYSDWGEILDCI